MHIIHLVHKSGFEEISQDSFDFLTGKKKEFVNDFSSLSVLFA